MKDVNGVEIRTGDVVVIKDAYFKNDNGLWYVDNSPGDVAWCGNDYCLMKLNKNGSLSEAKGKCSFWPLISFCNDRSKNIAARDWNDKNAKIEIIKFNRSVIADMFDEKAESSKMRLKRVEEFGKHSSPYLLEYNIGRFYKEVADRIRKEDA